MNNEELFQIIRKFGYTTKGQTDEIVEAIIDAQRAASQPDSNPIEGYGAMAIGPDRDGKTPMLYAPMDDMTEIGKALHAWRNKKPDSERYAALRKAIAEYGTPGILNEGISHKNYSAQNGEKD